MSLAEPVFGIAKGSFAEYACARADKLAPKPASLSFEQAAAVPVSALTALQAVRDRGKVQPEHNVLVVGASGGVGTFAVQIAKAFGADVTGVCSTSKMGMVRALGVDHVIDYTRDDFADGQCHYDLILEIGGNRPVSELRRALTPTGTLVIVGGETDGTLARWHPPPTRRTSAVRQKLGTFIASENAADLLVLRQLVESGAITPTVDRTYPLREAPAPSGT